MNNSTYYFREQGLFLMHSPLAYQLPHTLRSIAWGTAESLIFQGLLMLHHGMLFTVLGPSFGILGMTFSLIYLGALMGDAGFDSACTPYFSAWSTSRNAARIFFLRHHVLPVTLVGFTVTLGVAAGIIVTDQPYWYLFIPIVTWLEIYHKSLRSMLQLLGFAQRVAIIEISALMLYLAAIWSLYGVRNFISIPGILALHGAMLFFSSSYYFFLWFRWHRTLPIPSLEANFTNLAAHRTRMHLTALLAMPFSSNFLIPLGGYHYGVVTAAQLKLVTSFFHGFTSITKKFLFLASRLAWIHHAEHRITTLQTLTHYINHALGIIAVIIMLNYRSIPTFFNGDGPIFFLLFGLFTVGDLYLVSYERFLEASHSSAVLLRAHTISLLCSLPLLAGIAPSAPIFLGALLCVRAGILSLLIAMHVSVLRTPFNYRIIALTVVGAATLHVLRLFVFSV